MSKQLWITLCTLYISKHIRPRLPQALFCIFAVHKVSTENELVGMPVAEAPSLGRAAAVPWAPWRSCSQVSHELCFAVGPLAEPDRGSCGLHSVCSHQTHQWLSPSFLEQTGTFFFFFLVICWRGFPDNQIGVRVFVLCTTPILMEEAGAVNSGPSLVSESNKLSASGVWILQKQCCVLAESFSFSGLFLEQSH